MSTSTLQNFRVGSDLTVKVRLKDGGVAIDWSTLSGIRAVLYSDAQSSIAGRCDVTVDGEDPTLLVCRYAVTKMQYLGVNRIIVSAKYMGETKTYDKPAFTFVRWTADQEGEQITIEDPEVTVEIDVEDVSSSILQEAVDAAFSAADRANEAAEAAEHMVDIKTGPAGKSPYKGENGNWFEWDEEAGQYVDTGVRAKGETGDTPNISIGTVTTVEPGTPAGATMTGTPKAPVLNLSIPKGLVGATPNFTIGTVTTGEPGTPVVVTLTGTAEAPVLNITIPQGMQGNTGSSVDYPFELVNNLTTNDATKALSAAQGVVLDGKISQLQQKVNSLPRGKDYGFFTSSSLLPSGATEEGFAYVGVTEPYAIWQFDGTTWSDSGVFANAFTANNEQIQDAVDDYLQDHPTVSGTFLNVAKRKLISLLEKVAFIDEHGQDYINELKSALFLSPIDHIEAVFSQGAWDCYDIYRLEQLKDFLVVTVYYVDGSHSIESDYILSGTLVAGTSTITASVVDGVTGDTVTDTFNVTVIGTTKLYVDGDECTAVTGGWQKKGFNLTAGTPTIAKNSDHLLFKFATWNKASAAGTISTVNKIDVSGKTKCLCEIELYNETGWAGGWIYFPGTLAESTTQAGAFGSDFSSNRSIISSAPGSVTLVTGFQEPNVITTRTSDYISINFNAYQVNNSGYTPGAYLKVKRIAIV